MHPLIVRIFDIFPSYQMGIIGSGVLNPDGAKDIDVLFLVKEEFEQACREMAKRWNGWDAHNGHVRIANVVIDHRQVQFIHISTVTKFSDHPHCVLLRDGSFEREGVFFVKPEGWKYEKFPQKQEKGNHMARLIAIDFDNTINNNGDKTISQKYSKPYAGAKEAISLLREEGCKVMIFSCNRKKWIEEWLGHWEIPFDYIWEGEKPVCDCYIDDRGVGFRGDWDATLKDVKALFKVKAPWDK